MIKSTLGAIGILVANTADATLVQSVSSDTTPASQAGEVRAYPLHDAIVKAHAARCTDAIGGPSDNCLVLDLERSTAQIAVVNVIGSTSAEAWRTEANHGSKIVREGDLAALYVPVV